MDHDDRAHIARFQLFLRQIAGERDAVEVFDHFLPPSDWRRPHTPLRWRHFMVSFAMNAAHRKTLAAIFAQPVRSGVRWRDIEALFAALGAEMSEGRGSRVRVLLNGAEAVFHRPHPQPETDKGALKSVRRFLSEAGIEP
jgi:hypothetical protein